MVVSWSSKLGPAGLVVARCRESGDQIGQLTSRLAHEEALVAAAAVDDPDLLTLREDDPRDVRWCRIRAFSGQPAQADERKDDQGDEPVTAHEAIIVNRAAARIPRRKTYAREM